MFNSLYYLSIGMSFLALALSFILQYKYQDIYSTHLYNDDKYFNVLNIENKTVIFLSCVVLCFLPVINIIMAIIIFSNTFCIFNQYVRNKN